MIEYIRGIIDELTPTTAVIETGGIGYEINITVLDYGALEELTRNGGGNVRMFIHESIREDAHVLYGFLDRRSRELFRLLNGVSGVGPGTARLILSAMTPDMLENAIASEDATALKAVKGIGGKTAQRIIVDLKDKINSGVATLVKGEATQSGAMGDALSALVMLGFAAPACRKVLSRIFREEPGISAEGAIKRALKLL